MSVMRLSIPACLARAALVTMVACFSHGCGRTALLAPGTGEAPDAGVLAVTPTGGATSQPTVDGGCPDGYAPCGRGAAARCYDLTRAPQHCGQCGHVCEPGIACKSSQCQQYHCKGNVTFKALPLVLAGLSMGEYRPVLGDFDGDGTLDFVGPPGDGTPMALLLGRGDGRFDAHALITTPVGGWTAAAADLNGDGRLDLATVASDRAELHVRLGNRDPATSFDPATAYPLPKAPSDWWSSEGSWSEAYNLLLTDWNDDGKVDMVALEPVAPRKHLLSLWRGSASGRLSEAGSFAVGPGGALLASVDWNQDGVSDLVFGTSTLRMMLGRGDGAFDDEVACGLSLASGNALADFDHDQKVDLVVGSLGVFLGMTGCNFTSFFPVSSWTDTAEYGGILADSDGTADFDGDGHSDIVAHYSGTGSMKTGLFLGNGRGGFSSPSVLPTTETDDYGSFRAGHVFLMGDLDNDTKLDLIVTRPYGWQVLLNTCR